MFSSILTDGQSLLSLKDTYLFFISPKEDKERFIEAMGNYGMCNLIQNLVIYDNIYFDSSLLFGNKEIENLADNFNHIIKPVYIPSNIKFEIVHKLDNIGVLQDDIYYQEFSKIAEKQFKVHSYDSENLTYNDLIFREEKNFNTFMEAATQNRWFGDLINEKIKLFFNTKYEFTLEELEDNFNLPTVLRNSSQSYFRANYNLELAKSMNLPLSPHPVRSEYYDAILKEYSNLTTKIINKVDSRFRKYVNNNGLYHCLEIPSISDVIFSNCFKNGTCISDEVFELRESKYARYFRSMCRELIQMMEEHKDKQLSVKLQRLSNEISNLTDKWNIDMNIDVLYQKRKINLGKIPLIGTLLSIFDGWDRIEVKDPIIFHEKPYVIFLNKIYSERSMLPPYVK